MKSKEANIISWKILIDEKNNIITEISQVPEEKVEEIFGEDSRYVLAILQNAKVKLDSLHYELQRYLKSL